MTSSAWYVYILLHQKTKRIIHVLNCFGFCAIFDMCSHISVCTTCFIYCEWRINFMLFLYINIYMACRLWWSFYYSYSAHRFYISSTPALYITLPTQFYILLWHPSSINTSYCVTYKSVSVPLYIQSSILVWPHKYSLPTFYFETYLYVRTPSQPQLSNPSWKRLKLLAALRCGRNWVWTRAPIRRTNSIESLCVESAPIRRTIEMVRGWRRRSPEPLWSRASCWVCCYWVF